MALKMCKMWSNGIKTTFFPKNYEKSSSVCDTFELQYTSLLKHVSQFTHFRILTRLLV